MTETTQTPETTDIKIRGPLKEKAIAFFKDSGDHFFRVFKAMHGRLQQSAFRVFRHYDDMVSDGDLSEADLPKLHIDNITLVLRLWAGELNPPKSRKRNRAPTLYEQAKRAQDDIVLLAACRAICLELAWDWVQNECGARANRAEESEHWNQDANEERAYLWGQRHDEMSNLQGTAVSMIADEALACKTDKFVEFLGDNFEELAVD